MNNLTLINIFRFIGLVLLQVVVFNHINLFGFINPLIYIAWIFLYPFRKNISLFLIVSFALGLCVDFFSDSGGINAAATLLIAYIRYPILKIVLKRSDIDFLLFNIRTVPFGKAIAFISVLTIIHHFTIFSFAYFSFNNFLSIVSNTLLTSFFTVLIIILGILLLTKKK
ncbi:rod shape-determining protein MreD [Lutibacter sp. HS1-25]|uniref:rod shape-determining protein MreD n=1 Tax=Lutibacter sp. HS1-25 TaxID=2485000 RepID=UPI001013AF9D|nr:rod shape-determining protein MreD [Lutibacter sp. HS1-25]RXP52962.1 rod shape-determining protein MreD [Lutibacter sp. HS1-25]